MENERWIIHLDLDAFFCAVEELRDPSLRGKAFAVGGRPEERGVVASCSYAARRFGVRSAMPMARALKLCPGLVVLPGRHRDYRAASRQVMEKLHALTTQVEQISIDEAFLDVSDLPEPAEVLARRLQAEIHDQLGLPCSIGLASNKLVAKIATEVGKAAARNDSSGAPHAFSRVPPGSEAEFLAPLPVDMLWGVGPKTSSRLAELGIRTVGDLASWSEFALAQRFGKYGHEMARQARGLDDRPIITDHESKSISQETTFARDLRDEAQLRETIRTQAGQVARRLQQHNLCATTVRLKLRWPDFTTLTRQSTLERPADQAATITAVAEGLFERVWSPGRAVRLLGVGCSGLSPRPRQLSLWETLQTQPESVSQTIESEKETRLQEAVLELRQRFGDGILRRGFSGGEGE